MVNDIEKNPSFSPQTPSANVLTNLKRISEVFQKIESETAEIAEEIFSYLIDVSDENIMSGTIPIPDSGSKRLKTYLKILNRLFLLSRQSKENSFRIINRNTIRKLDKKTFTICMCYDGGVSLDILCDVVNTENQARTPNASPVKVTVRQFLSKDLTMKR
jgi:hypothetical protein